MDDSKLDQATSVRYHTFYEFTDVMTILFKKELGIKSHVSIIYNPMVMDVIRDNNKITNSDSLYGSSYIPEKETIKHPYVNSPAIYINFNNIFTVLGLLIVIYHELLHIKYPMKSETQIKTLVAKRFKI